MKPFNLEAALAGAKVMNGKKEPVTDIAYFPSVNSPYKVCALLNGGISCFTETGCASKKCTNSLLDLFMAPDISEGWINIYKGRRIGHYLYKTEVEARALSSSGLITCVRIEWEE
jgi:hypothetical protein